MEAHLGLKKSSRFSILILLALTAAYSGFAQNKSLGVGTATPNSNAALHVESPTANQGFILPRLTSIQRTAAGFTSILTAVDNGLMVYDNDLKQIFIWRDNAWVLLTNTISGFGIVGESNSMVFGIGVLGSMKGTSGFAGSFETTNAANNDFALKAYTIGGGPAGFFHIDNVGSTSPVINIANTGTGPAINATGYIIASSATNNTIQSSQTGLSNAGSFTVNNAANTNSAIYASTNGTGGVTSSAIFAETSTAFSAITARVNAGTSNAITGISNSTDAGSYAVLGQNNFAGPGGVFSSKDGTGLTGQTQSNVGGALAPVGVYGESTGTGSSAGAFRINNLANTYSSLFAETNGTGSAGNFNIKNASSTAPVLFATTTGTGAAFSGDNTSTGDVVFVQKTGASGSAGNFQITNATNPASALFAMTNASNGSSLGLINSANGNALSIFNGGMKVSSFTVSAGGAVTTRAAAYYVTGGVTFSLSFPQADGEIFFVYNSTGVEITFEGAAIPATSGKTCIYLGGALRSL